MHGKLFIVEGPDFVGKTTFTKALVEAWKQGVNPNAVWSREPGGTKEAEHIRNCIMDCGPDIDPRAAANLFFASRIISYTKEIIPLLLSGSDVFLDRSYLTSWVYQGIIPDRKVGGRENLDYVLQLTTNSILLDLAAHNIKPHHILISATPEQFKDRIDEVRTDGNSYDPRSLDEVVNKMNGYMELSPLLMDDGLTIVNSAGLTKMLAFVIPHITRGTHKFSDKGIERVDYSLEMLHD